MKYMEGNLTTKFKILIPARGGSKRILNKNTVDICGQPLISYSITQALKLTDEVYVSTDCNNISTVAEEWGAKIIPRPSDISGDHSKTEEAVKHFLELEDTDIIVVLQATTPLVKYDRIFEGIKMMDKFDSVVSVCEDKGFYWNSYGEPVNFIPGKRVRTQDMLPWYKENGAFYITTTESFKKSGLLHYGKVGFIVMDKNCSIDIDTNDDIKILKQIIKRNKL